MTRYLVTSALPYANGPIHFGHAVGAYLPADVYVRTLRQRGEDVLYICGTDEHGVAITLSAEAAGQPYDEYVAGWRAEIKSVFDRLGIRFDHWSGTSISPWHEETSLEFFQRLKQNGNLKFQTGEQLYCAHDEKFLADRYVEGECPKCGHPDARGDECPSCGSWLEAVTLVRPRCKICGNTPELKATSHWYLDLPKLRDEFIGEWFRSKRWKTNVEAFVSRLLADTLERPITRDLNWGIRLPPEEVGGETGKVLYVWFDAPIGYVSFTREWAELRGTPEAWKDYWRSPDTRLVHFLGKDNIPFHCVVFPSMLHGVQQDYVLPWNVPANEFYNLQGRKFSTSGGWSIPLDRFFEQYDSEVARFYLISSMPETSDSEWRWEEFQRCANDSLADTIGNLVTRVLRFVDKHFDGRIPPLAEAHVAELDAEILTACGPVADPVEELLEFRFRRAAERLIAAATVANVFVDRQAPWALRKTDMERCGSVLNTCCEWIALLARWMVPFMPDKAQQLWAMLGQAGEVAESGAPQLPAAGAWRRLTSGTRLGEVAGLFGKIDDATIARELTELEARAAARS